MTKRLQISCLRRSSMTSLSMTARAWVSCVIFLTLAAADLAAAAPRSEVIASGLENPWGVTFLPGGRFLVTERPGRLRVVGADGKLGPPVAGLPPIAVGGQGGLLDVLADSAFDKNRTFYFCFSE